MKTITTAAVTPIITTTTVTVTAAITTTINTNGYCKDRQIPLGHKGLQDKK